MANLFKFLYLGDFARIARCFREAADASALLPWELLPELEAIQSKAKAAGWRGGLPDPVAYGNVVAPAVSLLSTRAVLDAARVGLALELYRSANGDYPDTLSALAPDFLDEVPKDPFTGKELGYIRSGDDLTVYSVGRDLKYDSIDDYSAWKTKRPPPPPPRKRPSRKRKVPADKE